MKSKELYNEMLEALKSLGFKIRRDNGNFGGGACLFKDEKIIVLNKNLPLENHLSILSSVLYSFLDETYLKPKVREFVEKEGKSLSPFLEIIISNDDKDKKQQE